MASLAMVETGRLEGVRIALFSGNYNYLRDGANQALNRLVRHLQAEAGARVRVYSPVTDTPAFPPEGELVPVRSIRLPGRPDYRLGLGLPARVRADLDAFAPDLVHLSAPDLLGGRALAYARRRGLPVVASVHTRFETYFRHYGLGVVDRWIARRLRTFYTRCDFILAPTRALQREMGLLYGADRVRLWGRGVDAELFSPARRRPASMDGRPVVAWFGRLVREKGTELFARIVAELRARGHDFSVAVIGEGPARAALAALLSGAWFAGHLDGAALAAAVGSADLVLIPSETEAFGNVVLESMALALPVVAADLASTRNLIRPGENGLLAPAGDVGGFADCVARLLAAPELRQRLGEAGRATALRHDWASAMAGVEEVYAEALALTGRC